MSIMKNFCNSIKSVHSIELKEAQALIRDACTRLSVEQIALAKSAGRYPANPLVALAPLPGYDQSLRDGYAIGQMDGTAPKKSSFIYQIIDELAAGDTRELMLQPGEAIRIMTGGLLPLQCALVIPQELCVVDGSSLTVDCDYISGQPKTFIHAKGSEIAEGRVLAAEGKRISHEQLILLAGVGYATVQVVRKPQLSYFCTGNELVYSADEKIAGKKISANSPLLQSLTTQCGAELQGQYAVVDDPDAVVETLNEIVGTGCDIIVSTGGMGPGKYDFIKEVFCRSGGEIIYSSLNLLPGKSTLFGTFGNTLFFGLPGPPPAVHLLFNELIRPAILALQGAEQCELQEIEAHLTEDIFLSKGGLARLKNASLYFEEGTCHVRPTERSERSNCYIYCPVGRRQMRAGEKVLIHLLDYTFSG